MNTRRLRAFKRWMAKQGIDCSDALLLTDTEEQGLSVKTLCDLKKGDVVAAIPKEACLTVKTTGARELIETADLGGCLGLAVALMYEQNLGGDSPWAGYLQLLPIQECLPLLWTLDEVDSLLRGTELHKIVKGDKTLVFEDWRECILPLMTSDIANINPSFFGLEQYFAAKSLIASRSFEIDEYHGFGMVPLADLFNHKTGAEDVHFTSVSSDSEADRDTDGSNDNDTDELLSYDLHSSKSAATRIPFHKTCGRPGKLDSSPSGEDPTVLEMIMVKDVEAGSEVFNTYGSLGNAALLHRYGFTEPNNPYDIVNIDLELVLQWSSSLFSRRDSKARLLLWRRLGYSGCVSQNSEYFEISFSGEPQAELLTLLYIMLLPEERYLKFDVTASTDRSVSSRSINKIFSRKRRVEGTRTRREVFLTDRVFDALAALADARDSLYGSASIEDDIEALRRCCRAKESKLHHSLVLRVGERRILQKLRAYAGERVRAERARRKKVKR